MRGASSSRTAAVLSIGDELALGQTLDTNSAWIADRLFTLGVRVDEHTTVEDDRERIAGAMRRLVGGRGLVICTGGLGPTADDLTRCALGDVLGEALIEDAGALEAIRAWFAGRGGMPEGNLVQALRPPSARGLPNPHGTAPGLEAVIGEARVFCLPGPPHEMIPMFESFVVPAVSETGGAAVRSRIVLTFGLGESRVAERLGELMDRDRPARGLPLVGTTASRGVIACRLRHSGDSAETVARELDAVEAEIRARLGAAVFDRRDPTRGDPVEIGGALPGAVIGLLRARGERVAVAESCTGGLLGGELTRVPGSSDVFVGGWITYSNEMKGSLLGVPATIFEEHGAVSGVCALAMARGAMARGGCDHGLGVTGVAGPGGGRDEKPVGTVWIGRAASDGSAEARRFLFRGDREAVRGWAVRTALGMLRLHLVGEAMTLLGEVEAVA
jgi:nicotinamide-nucleotide amidase